MEINSLKLKTLSSEQLVCLFCRFSVIRSQYCLSIDNLYSQDTFAYMIKDVEQVQEISLRELRA